MSADDGYMHPHIYRDRLLPDDGYLHPYSCLIYNSNASNKQSSAAHLRDDLYSSECDHKLYRMRLSSKRNARHLILSMQKDHSLTS